MKKIYKIVGLVLLVGCLYVITMKFVMPFVMDVVSSDLFFKQTEDDPVGELQNNRTYMGLLHCENQLRADQGLSEATRPSAGESEYKAWGLGDHTYVIKAMLDVPGPDKNLVRTNVGCKIKYEGGEEADAKNWSIIGVGTAAD